MRGLKLVKTLDVVTITSQIIGANIQPSMVFMINQRMKTAVIDHYAVSNHNYRNGLQLILPMSCMCLCIY